MKKKRTLLTSLLIVLAPFAYKLTIDIFKMGVKDGKAHVAHRIK
ncbi:hypothetical protein [Pedobacter sp. Hv1]|nr:hypothetical protein [Pedobacter sp. Hv1]